MWKISYSIIKTLMHIALYSAINLLSKKLDMQEIYIQKYIDKIDIMHLNYKKIKLPYKKNNTKLICNL